MKTKLLFSALCVSLAAFAQEPIPAFYNFNTTPGNTAGNAYIVATQETPLDESAAGANVTWNFNGLEEDTRSATVVTTPSADDIAEYPGTTMLVETTTQVTGGQNVTRYFLMGSTTGSTSLTGFEVSGMELNYTDNAFIGQFPLSYGYNNSDLIAGTFSGLGVQGTFTGTGTSTVDAYGTLNVDLGFSEGVQVSRLKATQNISLTYLGFPAGTLTQTIYSYYSPAILADGPVFRTITITLVAPLLGINQTSYNVEVYNQEALGTGKPARINNMVIAPNPVADVLHLSGNAVVTGVTITDLSGRTVLQSKASNDISVSHLSAGVYNVAVQSETGSQTIKMIRK